MNQQHPRSQARRLVDVMHRGDDESLVLELARLTADRVHGGRESHLIVCELLAALAQMLHTASGPGEPAYGLEIADDDDNQIDIDDASPPVRAAVRALLAQLNHHPDDAGFQVDLALQEETLQATIEVFAHVLLWTMGMLKWCSDNNVPTPGWLPVPAGSKRW